MNQLKRIHQAVLVNSHQRKVPNQKADFQIGGIGHRKGREIHFNPDFGFQGEFIFYSIFYVFWDPVVRKWADVPRK